MVSMSSLDAINIDDGFDERDNTQTSYKPFHYVDENSPFKNVFVDVSYVKNCIDTHQRRTRTSDSTLQYAY